MKIVSLKLLPAVQCHWHQLHTPGKIKFHNIIHVNCQTLCINHRLEQLN